MKFLPIEFQELLTLLNPQQVNCRKKNRAQFGYAFPTILGTMKLKEPGIKLSSCYEPKWMEARIHALMPLFWKQE